MVIKEVSLSWGGGRLENRLSHTTLVLIVSNTGGGAGLCDSQGGDSYVWEMCVGDVGFLCTYVWEM